MRRILLLQISLADRHSCSGQIPGTVWERLQKNFFSRTEAWNGKKFSCKIDGIEVAHLGAFLKSVPQIVVPLLGFFIHFD